MTAGLPGSGIGGLFFLLSVAWMPFHELGLTLRGRSSARRWRVVGVQVALAGGILSMLWAQAWLLEVLLVKTMAWSMGLSVGVDEVSRFNGRVGALGAVVVLCSVVIGIEMLSRLLARRDGSRVSPTLPIEPPVTRAYLRRLTLEVVFGSSRDQRMIVEDVWRLFTRPWRGLMN